MGFPAEWLGWMEFGDGWTKEDFESPEYRYPKADFPAMWDEGKFKGGK